MKVLKCPICERDIQLSDKPRAGERLTCSNCYAQLALRKFKGKLILGCAYCKDPVFDPVACDECERRHERKRELIEEGRL